MAPHFSLRPGLAALLLALSAAGAGAHGEKTHHASPAASAAHAVAEQQAFGIAGDPRRVTRSISLVMGDDMRFTPAHLRVREGETLRLRLHNRGTLMHELVIGSRETLAQHAELMQRFPDMEHEEAHMSHVPPGQHGEIVWHFNRAGEFEFACLIAGHYQAGMRGRISVIPRSPKP